LTVPNVPLLLARAPPPPPLPADCRLWGLVVRFELAARFGFAPLDLAVPFFDAVLRLRADAADLVLVCPRDLVCARDLFERLLGWVREFGVLAICPSPSGSPLPVDRRTRRCRR
jgi:hypothetical protein